LTQEMITEFGKAKAYVSGASQPSVVRLSITQYERLQLVNRWALTHKVGKSHGQLERWEQGLGS